MARRRGAGVGALKKKRAAQQRFQDVGSKLEADSMAHIAEQLGTFKAHLEAFATKHKKEINSNPVFRQQFAKMCTSIGVDPLKSSKGFWAEMLGVGDFYYELGVQIVDLCLATRSQNGGLIGVEELRAILQARRAGSSGEAEISEDDVVRSVEKLKGLGNGFKLIHAGGRALVCSVPIELSADHSAVLGLAQQDGGVTQEQMQARLGWSADRAMRALDVLTRDGVLWLDVYSESDEKGARRSRTAYWAPSMMPGIFE